MIHTEGGAINTMALHDAREVPDHVKWYALSDTHYDADRTKSSKECNGALA